MRRIFLDVGADIGESVKFFRSNHPEANQFEIFSFEPHPVNIEKLRQIEGITLIEKAVWINDQGITMYFGKPKSSTVYSDKRTGRVDANDKHLVPTIDLVKFIKENFQKTDEIWMKMNIEGAEYQLIPYLYQSDILSWINRVYIKWHIGKIPSITEEQNITCKSMVKEKVSKVFYLWRTKEILPF